MNKPLPGKLIIDPGLVDTLNQVYGARVIPGPGPEPKKNHIAQNRSLWGGSSQSASSSSDSHPVVRIEPSQTRSSDQDTMMKFLMDEHTKNLESMRNLLAIMTPIIIEQKTKLKPAIKTPSTKRNKECYQEIRTPLSKYTNGC